ncbi:hypothetical protein lerEdw1_001487 [Lerista edwardsae]|nr:hypothetical protein lerEdw1_001487 [Lerista edwardsae]
MENPHATLAHERDSLKVNVFCAITNSSVFGLFFFVENTITGFIYRDMLSEWLLPQLDEAVPDFILQQDGAPPHWHNNDLRQLKQRISDVLDSITPDMLAKVWQELDYRIDICRVTGGAHIEQL